MANCLKSLVLGKRRSAKTSASAVTKHREVRLDPVSSRMIIVQARYRPAKTATNFTSWTATTLVSCPKQWSIVKPVAFANPRSLGIGANGIVALYAVRITKRRDSGLIASLSGRGPANKMMQNVIGRKGS